MKSVFSRFATTVFCATVVCLTWGTSADALQYYYNDFQGNSVGSEWSSSLLSKAPNFENRQFLGEFGNHYNDGNWLNDNLSLTLGSLPIHNQVKLSFDLYLIRSWDGEAQGYSYANDPNGPYFGKDYFNVLANGASLLRETFSNGNTAGQSYGDGSSLSGSSERYTLGYQFDYYDTNLQGIIACYNLDSVYHFDFTFLDSSSSLNVSFFGDAKLQNILDESWGLDNVGVSVVTVPETSTILLLIIGGFSLLGFRRCMRKSFSFM